MFWRIVLYGFTVLTVISNFAQRFKIEVNFTMSKKRGLFILGLALCVAILCVIGFLAVNLNRSHSAIPAEVSEVVENYMDAYKKGTEYSVEYAHFEDEFMRTAYIVSGDKLLDYKIESAEKINDNLFAFTIMVKTEQTAFYSGDVYERVYNFVARIDNEWYFLNGVAHIPADIQDGLDKSKYVYTDDRILDPGDVIDTIVTPSAS